MEKFTVGTDKRKSISTGLPHPAFVGSIRDILKVSVEKKACLAMGQLGVPEEKRKCFKEKAVFNSCLFKPDYFGIYLKIKSLGFNKTNGNIGRQVLQLRAILEEDNYTIKEKNRIKIEAKKFWARAIRLADKRKSQKHAPIIKPLSMESSTNDSTNETAPPQTNPQTSTVPQTSTIISESNEIRSATTTRSATSRLQLLTDIAEQELSKPNPKPRKTKVIAK